MSLVATSGGGYTSYIVPFEELTVDDVRKIRQEALSALTQMIRDNGKNPADYVVRDLQATDLGYSAPDFTTSVTATGWQQLASLTVPENKFIVIFGFEELSPEPKFTSIKLYNGAKPVAWYDLQKIYGYRTLAGYFEVQRWMPGQVLSISAYASATGTDVPVILGLVAELSGQNIARPGPS